VIGYPLLNDLGNDHDGWSDPRGKGTSKVNTLSR
jgi:hypothetical protein